MSPFGLFYSLYVNVFCSFQVGLASVCQSFHLQNNPGIRRAVCSVSIKLLFSFRSELPAHYFSSNKKQLCSNTKKYKKNYRSRTHDIIIKTIFTETLQSSVTVSHILYDILECGQMNNSCSWNVAYILKHVEIQY